MIESLKCLTFCSFAAVIAGCTQQEGSKIQAAPDSTNIVQTTVASSSSLAAVRDTGAEVTLVADSASNAPTVEIRSGRYFVHISKAMQKLLHDSLPGFIPLSPSAYELAVVQSAKDDEASDSLFSTLVADFDDDGEKDMAMIASARDSVATLMLVSNGNAARPRLILFGRPTPAHKAGENYIYLHRPDRDLLVDGKPIPNGVEEVFFGKASVVYYLDHGLLRSVQTSD